MRICKAASVGDQLVDTVGTRRIRSSCEGRVPAQGVLKDFDVEPDTSGLDATANGQDSLNVFTIPMCRGR